VNAIDIQRWLSISSGLSKRISGSRPRRPRRYRVCVGTGNAIGIPPYQRPHFGYRLATYPH
jgi:hypothetical protein